MTKVVEVSKANVRCDESVIDDYISVLNGISFACKRYDEYSEGSRNTVAVDLTVAAYMLGLDAQEEMKKFVSAGLIDPLNDDESPAARVIRVLDYCYKFDWDWMIDPDQYIYPNVLENNDDVVLWYKLVN